jgi:hypothetical protein
MRPFPYVGFHLKIMSEPVARDGPGNGRIWHE